MHVAIARKIRRFALRRGRSCGERHDAGLNDVSLAHGRLRRESGRKNPVNHGCLRGVFAAIVPPRIHNVYCLIFNKPFPEVIYFFAHLHAQRRFALSVRYSFGATDAP
jgi:hypothetical protein